MSPTLARRDEGELEFGGESNELSKNNFTIYIASNKNMSTLVTNPKKIQNARPSPRSMQAYRHISYKIQPFLHKNSRAVGHLRIYFSWGGINTLC